MAIVGLVAWTLLLAKSRDDEEDSSEEDARIAEEMAELTRIFEAEEALRERRSMPPPPRQTRLSREQLAADLQEIRLRSAERQRFEPKADYGMQDQTFWPSSILSPAAQAEWNAAQTSCETPGATDTSSPDCGSTDTKID